MVITDQVTTASSFLFSGIFVTPHGYFCLLPGGLSIDNSKALTIRTSSVLLLGDSEKEGSGENLTP